MNSLTKDIFLTFLFVYLSFCPWEQVSVGTLLAFTTVAVSVLILRYVPPDEMPLSPSLQEYIGSLSLQFGDNVRESDNETFPSPSSCENVDQDLHEKGHCDLVLHIWQWLGTTRIGLAALRAMRIMAVRGAYSHLAVTTTFQSIIGKESQSIGGSGLLLMQQR